MATASISMDNDASSIQMRIFAPISELNGVNTSIAMATFHEVLSSISWDALTVAIATASVCREVRQDR